MGLGSGGNPLTDVAKNLPSAGNNQQGMSGNQGPPNIQSPNAAAAAVLGAAGLGQLQSLLPTQQMQNSNPPPMPTFMGATSQGNSSNQGATSSGGGITNELSALAALARQLQNAGGLQGLSSALTGNMNGNNGPNSGGSTMPMGMKNEPPPSGLGMNQVFSIVDKCNLMCYLTLNFIFDHQPK